jgi:hypothetical protein
MGTMASKWFSDCALVAASTVLAVGCSSARVASKTASSVPSSRSTTVTATTSTTRPPDMVNGIPLRRLAELARVTATVWSEPHPFNIRAAVGSDRAANALMGRDGATYNYGETLRAYVIALDGHFSCKPPRCEGTVVIGVQGPSGGLTLPPTTTTTPSPVPISTILLTIDPKTLQEDGSFRQVGHEVDMNKLGRVYLLDRY